MPIAGRTWRTYNEIADLFKAPADPDWELDRDLIDQSLRDPWATT
ncbi:hypothetical protein [Actinocrispum wychmicini]|uniref:Uncharacterized protein n=1 Tax=Actinocrispum wychmicini TaxID=1213861 RepID=A0A4R2JIR0_9PSEU|nr:hypothetical protein [Actinocrispum wychmicini]TCO58657.1 hypothetical protein EV192_105728 [Actinocrispum wychmicini]